MARMGIVGQCIVIVRMLGIAEKAESMDSSKEYKIDPSDRWIDANPIGCKVLRLKAHMYLLLAKPVYCDGLQVMMEYA